MKYITHTFTGIAAVSVLFDHGGQNVRVVFNPGDDVTGLPPAVQDEINAYWTSARIAEWEQANERS